MEWHCMRTSTVIYVIVLHELLMYSVLQLPYSHHIRCSCVQTFLNIEMTMENDKKQRTPGFAPAVQTSAPRML